MLHVNEWRIKNVSEWNFISVISITSFSLFTIILRFLAIVGFAFIRIWFCLFAQRILFAALNTSFITCHINKSENCMSEGDAKLWIVKIAFEHCYYVFTYSHKFNAPSSLLYNFSMSKLFSRPLKVQTLFPKMENLLIFLQKYLHVFSSVEFLYVWVFAFGRRILCFL